MSYLESSLLYEPCRVPGIDPEGEYPNKVVAVWVDEHLGLLVASVDDKTGKTSVLPFLKMEFRLGSGMDWHDGR